MDGRTFDNLARSLAQRANRRSLLAKGLILSATAVGLTQSSPAGAARRGKPPTSEICVPDGVGGFNRSTVNNALLPRYLAAGAVLYNGCCLGLDCEGGSACADSACDMQTGACVTVPVSDGTLCTPEGPVNLCRAPYACQAGVCSEGIGTTCTAIAGGCQMALGCNPATGQCEVGNRPNGYSCLRGDGCVNGTCWEGVCLDPTPVDCLSDACRSCGYDACSGGCICSFTGCAPTYPECQTGSCDPAIGCVFTNINDGELCSREGGFGYCTDGNCLFLE